MPWPTNGDDFMKKPLPKLIDKFAGKKRAIAELIASGTPLKEMCARMKMSESAIKYHLYMIRAVIGANNLYEAAAILNRN